MLQKTNHSNINESKTENGRTHPRFYEIELIDAYNGCCHPIEIKKDKIHQGNKKSEEKLNTLS